MNRFVQHVKHGTEFVPLWNMLSYPFGYGMRLRYNLVQWTSKLEVVGYDKHLEPCVYINWHQHLPYLCQFHGIYNRWLMMSGAPYMNTINYWCTLSGLKVIQFGYGRDIKTAQDALNVLKDALKFGESVVVAVDGPAGPALKVKRGCIELAQASGCPIVHVSYTLARGKPDLNRWDQWLTPLLFDQIRVVYHPPLYVGESESIEDAQRRIETAYMMHAASHSSR